MSQFDSPTDDTMIHLTRHQQKAIAVALLLMLLGWSVKAWKLAHPAPRATIESSE